MADKIKVADKFDGVIALLNGEPTEMSVEDAVAFITERKAMHTKKSAGERKPTAKQVENEGIKAQIVEVLSASELPMTVGDIMEAVGVDSNRRVTALLTQLVDKGNGPVVRTEVKGKAFYGLPSDED